MNKEIEQDGFITREEDLKVKAPEQQKSMVLINNMPMPCCCSECRLKDNYYQECNVMYKKIATWLKNYTQRPEWCPLREVISYGPEGTFYKEK